MTRLIKTKSCECLLFCIFILASPNLFGQVQIQQPDNTTQKTLVIKKYGTRKTKRIRQGTIMKVTYPQDWREVSGIRKWWVMFTKTGIGRGKFHSISGDTIRLMRKDQIREYDIDHLSKVNEITGIEARIFGGGFVLAGVSGMGLGSVITLNGIVLFLAGDPWWAFFPAIGLPVLGIGFLAYKLGKLLLRVGVYDLNGDWYIQRGL